MVCGMAHGRQKLAAGERHKTPALEPKATVGWCTFVSYQTLRVRRMVRALIGNAFCGGSVSKPQVSSLDKALGKCLKKHRLRARIRQRLSSSDDLGANGDASRSVRIWR